MVFVSNILIFYIFIKVILDAITGHKTVMMSYMNYDVDIRHKLNVELVGWPESINFTSPSHISNRSALHAVHDALRSGVCHWVTLSRELQEELRAKISSGKVRKKAHATHADKGTKCPAKSRPSKPTGKRA